MLWGERSGRETRSKEGERDSIRLFIRTMDAVKYRRNEYLTEENELTTADGWKLLPFARRLQSSRTRKVA